MKVVINKILEKLETEVSDIFNIFEVTPIIERVIGILKESNYAIIAQAVDTVEFAQIKSRTLFI